MIEKKDLSKIGIGTFGVGGMMEKDLSLEDQPQVDALKYSIQHGLNYLDTSFLYAQEHAANILKQAITGFDREKLFLNCKLGNIDSVTDIEKQLDKYLYFFDFEYIDSFQIHSPSRIKAVGIEKTSEEIARLVDKGKTRFFSVSNVGPKNLEKANKASGNKIFSVENDYSYDVRPCEDIGILDFCTQHDILFIPYRPIRRHSAGMVTNLNYPLVNALAKKYNKSPNQILVNWYAWKENVMPIIKSTQITHISQNLQALEFKMDVIDYEKMDNFRISHDKWNDIDWEYDGTGGTKISALSFVFEE